MPPDSAPITIEALEARQHLQQSFANLTAEQQEWLLVRRYHSTDKGCSETLYGKGGRHVGWKRANKEFQFCYSALIEEGGWEIDEALVESLAKSNALKALIEERKILEMGWDKIAARLGTVKGSAMKAAIDRAKPPKSVTEHVYKIGEVAKEVAQTTV